MQVIAPFISSTQSKPTSNTTLLLPLHNYGYQSVSASASATAYPTYTPPSLHPISRVSINLPWNSVRWMLWFYLLFQLLGCNIFMNYFFYGENWDQNKCEGWRWLVLTSCSLIDLLNHRLIFFTSFSGLFPRVNLMSCDITVRPVDYPRKWMVRDC